MPNQIISTGRGKRLAAALAAGLVSVALSLPALAVDTGGGGGTSGGGGAPSSSSSGSGNVSHSGGGNDTMAPAVVHKPTVKLIDLDSARALIAKNNWDGAIKLLRVIVVQQPKNADALNLLGYSLRNKGDMAEAESWYLKALKLKPTHLGANEYLGELYVLTGHIDKAKARLAAIAKICGNTTCEEYADLNKAISAKA